MAFHFIVRFEPKAGSEDAFRAELMLVSGPSRAETGCLGLDVFESVRSPIVFSIHSRWVDEAAFESHAAQPHTASFVEAARKLLTHPIEGLRLKQIA